VLNLLAYDQNMRYSYSLDSRDFDGTNPLSTSDMRIDLSFWTCPTDADDGIAIGANTVAMSFRDSIGQILIDVGYTGDNLLLISRGWSSNMADDQHQSRYAGLVGDHHESQYLCKQHQPVRPGL
jgi:hypothetical protein